MPTRDRIRPGVLNSIVYVMCSSDDELSHAATFITKRGYDRFHTGDRMYHPTGHQFPVWITCYPFGLCGAASKAPSPESMIMYGYTVEEGFTLHDLREG